MEVLLAYLQRLGSGFAVLLIILFAAWILRKLLQRRRFLKQLVAARITPEELRDRIEAGEDLYIVDLRGNLENEMHSVPGAVRMSAEDLPTRAAQFPRGREIILFCS